MRTGEKENRFAFQECVFFCPPNKTWYASRKHLARGVKTSGMTNEDFYIRYGKDFMFDLWNENEHDEKYGNSRNVPNCLHCGRAVKFDNGHWHYHVFCGFPCSTKWHADNTDRIEKALQTRRDLKAIDPKHGLNPTSKAYWTNKGFTDDEASEKVILRQQTNTLEKFINRFGIEDGYNEWSKRQDRWLESLKKSGMFRGYSNIALEMFTSISHQVEGLKFGEDEVRIKGKTTTGFVDCLSSDGSRIVEFFGDYWHGNPRRFAPDKLIPFRRNKMITAIERNEVDRIRVSELEELGYQVLVVWEMDYKGNPTETIDKCVHFLKGLNT